MAGHTQIGHRTGVTLSDAITQWFEIATLVAAEAVTVRAQILIVRSKHTQGGCIAGQQIVQRAIPRRGPVVEFHVPGVIGNGIEGYLRALGILHRIAHESAHVVGDVEAIAVGGAEQNVVAHKIVDREIQPDVGFALDAGVDPVHAFLIDGVHHRVAGPHHLDAGIQRAAQGVEILVAVATPCAIVDGGAQQ